MLLLLSIYSHSASQIFFSLRNSPKSNVGAGITGKIPQNEVCFFKALNMDDKIMQLGLGFFLRVAGKHVDEQNKSQMSREFIFAFTLLRSELYTIPIES